MSKLEESKAKYRIEIGGVNIAFDENGEVVDAWEFSELADQPVRCTKEVNDRRAALRVLPYQSLSAEDKFFLNDLCDWFHTAKERDRAAREYSKYDSCQRYKEDRERKIGC